MGSGGLRSAQPFSALSVAFLGFFIQLSICLLSICGRDKISIAYRLIGSNANRPINRLIRAFSAQQNASNLNHSNFLTVFGFNVIFRDFYASVWIDVSVPAPNSSIWVSEFYMAATLRGSKQQMMANVLKGAAVDPSNRQFAQHWDARLKSKNAFKILIRSGTCKMTFSINNPIFCDLLCDCWRHSTNAPGGCILNGCRKCIGMGRSVFRFLPRSRPSTLHWWMRVWVCAHSHANN